MKVLKEEDLKQMRRRYIVIKGKRAAWIHGTDSHGYPYCFCSACKQDAIFKDIYHAHVKSPYCPNCGAQMEGRANERP